MPDSDVYQKRCQTAAPVNTADEKLKYAHYLRYSFSHSFYRVPISLVVMCVINATDHTLFT